MPKKAGVEIMPRYDDFSVLADLPPLARGGYTSIQAYGDWLGRRAPWQLFCTLTVKDLPGYTIGVAGAERFLRSWFRNSVRSRSFAGGTVAYGAFALESHSDRVSPHFHGLIGGLPQWVVHDVAIGMATHDRRRSYLWREWFADHGRARIETITGVLGDVSPAQGCARYASKYMLKEMGKFYALGTWPQTAEYDDSPTVGDEVNTAWEYGPGSRNAERIWREMCETL